MSRKQHLRKYSLFTLSITINADASDQFGVATQFRRETTGGSLITQGSHSGKMGRHFPVREKSGNFEQTGTVRENHTKYWKIQGISDKYYLLCF